MSKKLLYVGVALACCVGRSAVAADPRPPLISIVQLLADPGKFDEQRVAVAGFLSLELEGAALYVHKDDFEYHLSKNALYLLTPKSVTDKKQCFDGKYVAVVGTLNARNLGHMGMFSGLIEVEEVLPTTPPQPGCT